MTPSIAERSPPRDCAGAAAIVMKSRACSAKGSRTACGRALRPQRQVPLPSFLHLGAYPTFRSPCNLALPSNASSRQPLPERATMGAVRKAGVPHITEMRAGCADVSVALVRVWAPRLLRRRAAVHMFWAPHMWAVLATLARWILGPNGTKAWPMRRTALMMGV